ncbi:MAG: hypothetical protein JO147_13425, partial [Actinobacteria bacterium]|nr:hypothetical protein [Actinomycetota bacterium]
MLLGLSALVAISAGAAASPVTNVLASGSTLTSGQSLESPNGNFSLAVQGDGNVVLYDALLRPIWATGTGGKGVGALSMQADGNAVLYHAGAALWATGTAGNAGARLILQDDGNLVLYTAGGAALWASRSTLAAGSTGNPNFSIPSRPQPTGATMTAGQQLSPGQSMKSANGNFSLVMQADGNVVLYDAVGRPQWSSGTLHGSSYLSLQADGSLALFWRTGNQRIGSGSAATLTLQNDGNLVLTAITGAALWASGTVLPLGSSGNPNPAVPPPALTNGWTLSAGQTITNGQALTSPGGMWSAFMQSDGNLVVVGPGLLSHWSSNS